MSNLVTMRKLLESGSHFGHQTRRWNPKMKSYVYTSKAGTHIIDLYQTLDAIETAYAKMREIGERNGKVLFVGTKKQAQTIVLDEALRSGSFFINQRWLGGLLTNFRTIQKSIRRLLEIEAMETNGSINVYPKKEIIQLRKEATRLETFLGGIKEMKKLPDAVFVVDPTEDTIPVLEARKLGIPVFGIMDTNSDPNMLDYGIPANDDAVRSVRLIVGLMADALIEAKGGVLAFAYQKDEEEKDISMIDVIINVERQNEENDRRRRQRNDERRQRQDRRTNYKGNRDNNRDNRRDTRDSRPTENKPVVNNTTSENKPVENNTAIENKPVENNTASENKPVETKTASENKPVETKTVSENKPVETTTATENKPETAQVEKAKTVRKVKTEVVEKVSDKEVSE